MSRHRTAFHDYDGYDDDDYDEYYDYDEEEEDDEYSKQYAPPSKQNTGMVMGDFLNDSLNKPKVEESNMQVFFGHAREFLGTEYINTLSEDDLTSVFYMFDGNVDQAMAYLLQKFASVVEEPSKPLPSDAIAVAAPPPGFTSPSSIEVNRGVPPGFIPPGYSTLPTPPSKKTASSVATSTPGSACGVASGQKPRKNVSSLPSTPATTPSKATTENISVPPLDRSLARVKQNEAQQPSLTRSGSKSGLATSSSSGQLNRAAALSDDDLDPEEPPATPTAPGGSFKHGEKVSSASGDCRSTLPHLSMVVAGHVDAGKSTLVGNLLHQIGLVNARTIRKYEKNAQAVGKSSFFLAWVMDESESERSQEHGVTIGVAERYFQTEVYRFTVLDAPGHRDFIPNLISGATEADVALLVIPATLGEYESAMGDNAQTREHAVLLKALGVNQVVVVVNKMDMTTPAWCPTRFIQIEEEVRALLSELQFGPRAVRVVPVSSLEGINLTTPPAATAAPELVAWYTGPTLLELMNTFKEPPRLINKPLRATITGILSEGAKGFEVQVKVLQGRLRKRRGVGVATIQGVLDVKRIMTEDGSVVDRLCAGEKGVVQLIDRANRSYEEIKLRDSMVLYKGPPFPPVCSGFKATILTLSPLVPPIIPGSTFELYLHGEEVQCHIRKLYSVTSRTGTKKHPKCIPGDRSASVQIELVGAVCLEEFNSCRSLGRFALRSKGKTYAVGICDKVIAMDSGDISSSTIQQTMSY